MGNIIPWCALAAAGGLVLGGCTVEQTITVENLNLNGAQSSVPLHVTNDSASALRAVVHFYPGTKTGLTGDINDPPPPGSKKGILQWTLPSIEAGIDFDFPLSRSISLALGAGTSDKHWGCNAGFGFRSQNEGTGVRLDVGFEWQSLTYDVNYLQATTTTSIFGTVSDTVAVHRSESASHGDFYAALTVNSVRPVGAVNFFVQFGYAHQTLYDVDSEFMIFPFFGWSDKTTVSCSNLSILPGLYIDLTRTMRIVAGARFLWPLGLSTTDPACVIAPVVLFDLGL